MDPFGRLWPLAFLCLLLSAPPALTSDTAPEDHPHSLLDRVTELWQAESPKAVERAMAALKSSGASFEEVYRALEAGPRARPEPPMGKRQWLYRSEGIAYPFTVRVPASYDPERKIAVRVYLHGGISVPKPQRGDPMARVQDRLVGEDFLAVFPQSWDEAPWWSRRQVTSLEGILRRLKGIYNVDESRVFLYGISDGGTGAWYQAFRAPTPWAAFLPFIGHPGVLASRHLLAESAGGMQVQGEMFVPNLANRAFLVANGGRDPLYPAAAVAPYLDLFRRGGAEIDFRPQPESGHDTSWWPREASAIETFLEDHPREAHPRRLSWQTEDPESAGRVDWLVVEELAPAAGESRFRDDLDRLLLPPDPQRELPARRLRAFPRSAPSGRLEVEARGNRIEVRSQGVRRFRLLLSPAAFDLAAPLEVEVNGRTVFQGRIEPSLDTLLHWAARDLDRTRLYGAELVLDL